MYALREITIAAQEGSHELSLNFMLTEQLFQQKNLPSALSSLNIIVKIFVFVVIVGDIFLFLCDLINDLKKRTQIQRFHLCRLL